MVKGSEGERTIVPPARIERGETLVRRQGNVSRLFKVGEAVIFSPQEFAELCWTLNWFGRTLVQNLEAYGSF